MQQKIVIYAGIAIVIGAVIAVAAFLSAKGIKENGEKTVEEQAQQQQQEVDQAMQQQQQQSGTSTTTTSGSPTMTYAQAVVKYADRRIQFDANCIATPVIATFKNGTEIMLDNRAGVRRNFHVDGVRYTINGLSYRIVKLTAKTFPYTIQIDCGTGKNNANIYLQK